VVNCRTCRDHGVALRIDENGDLVVGKAGAKADEPTQPWRALLTEIEANLEAVARLVESAWHLRVDFPKGAPREQHASSHPTCPYRKFKL
jgi:hypothetical protein